MTDAFTLPGDSGSPVLDENGQVCADPSAGAGYKICPTGTEAAAWSKRFDQAALTYGSLSLGSPFHTIVAAAKSLHQSRNERRNAASDALRRYLLARNPPADIYLAYAELLSSNDGQGLVWNGTDLVDLVKAWKLEGDGARNATTVAYAFTEMEDLGLIPKGAARQRYAEILANPEVSLGDKLYVEAYAFDLGYLEP